MQIKFNRIYIIESLQSEDRKTGTELYKDLLQWKNVDFPDFKSILVTPKTHDDFMNMCDKILEECKNENVFPILHFEIHGNSDRSGLVLSSGESVTWEELSDELRAINYQLKNSLFITMGVCHGCYFLSKDIVDKPSLFQGIVASFDILYDNSIYIQFYAFYEELFKSFDLNEAYLKLIEANPGISESDKKTNYALYSSEFIFAMVQTDYEEKEYTKAALEKRALNEIASGHISCKNRRERRKLINKFVKLALSKKNLFFEKAYKQFFMLNDYPDLAEDLSYPCNIQEMKKWYKNLRKKRLLN